MSIQIFCLFLNQITGGGGGGGLGDGRVMIAAQLTFIELLLCARNYSEHI